MFQSRLLLTLTSLLFALCLCDVTGQPDTDSMTSLQDPARRATLAHILRKLADQIEPSQPVDLRRLQLSSTDGSTLNKRSCFNVLDPCCMWNVRCDRFAKKRMNSFERTSV